MKDIAEGIRPRQLIYDEALAEMKKIFIKTSSQAGLFQNFFKTKKAI